MLLSVLRVMGIQSSSDVLTLASREDADGIDMISTENEQSALHALGHALHTMARQLALNLISDDSLQGASNLAPVRPRAMASIAEEDNEADEVNEPGLPTPKQAQACAAAEEREKQGGINMLNAKILCQSEYVILQAALAEISERLDRLPPPSATVD